MEYDFRKRVASLLVVLAVVFCASFALAQGIVTGSISGTVEDPQGAVVAGAKVTAKHLATNREFNTEASAGGVVSLRNLPTGAYNVRIEAAHFRTFESKGLVITAGTDSSVGRVVLEVGASSETVTVEGSAPLIETTTQQISQSFDSQKTTSLPVGNNFDSLTLFVPGVAAAGDAGFSNTNGSGVSVNGQRARSNNFQIDGQANNDNSIGGPSVFFGNQDAISEVQVITNYDAQYGRNTGSVVNYITKSGTNQFHGTGYEFWQGNTFSSMTNEEESPVNGFCAQGQSTATGCVNPHVPAYVDNRFGGSIGGPIFKDKVWFFASTNLERQRTEGSPSTSAGLVPTANGVATLLTAYPNSPVGPLYAAIGPAAITTQGNPTFSNVQTIQVSDQVDPATGTYFDQAGCAANPTMCTGVEFGTITRFVPSPFNDYEVTGRVDFKVTNKDNFFGRYVFQQTINDGINFGNGVDVGDWQKIPGRDQQMGLDWSRTISNTFVNQVRFSYSRAKFFFNEGSVPACNDQAPTACPTDVLMGVLGSQDPQDKVSFGVASGFPQGRIINVYQLQDNASKQIGKHTVKFGGEYDKQRSPSLFLPNNNVLYLAQTFNDIVGNSLLQARPTIGDPHLPFHEKDVAFYIQDDWRIKDNLTLNLGMRWEWNEQAINLLHDRTVAVQASSTPLWDNSFGASQTEVPSVPQDLNNFSPVVGFAWTPRIGGKMLGENKTVIRGGFRISYDPAFYNMFLNVATSSPSVNAVTLGGAGALPLTGSFTGNDLIPFLAPLTDTTGLNPGIRNHTIVAPNFRNPYSEQWNLGVQREITSKIVGEVRYVANHGVALFQTRNGNPAIQPFTDFGFPQLVPPGFTACTDPTTPGGSGATIFGTLAGYSNCNFRRVVERANTAWSKYNSLQSELRIGNWHGVTSTLSYTWSHTMDNASEVYSTAAGGSTQSYGQNPFNQDRPERANSGFDFRNLLGLAFIYDMPFDKAQQGFLGHVLGGWQLNTTYRYSTGQPYTIIDNVEGNLCDPTSTLSGVFDACRPFLSSASAPLNAVGFCTDPAAPGCGLVQFNPSNGTFTPSTASNVHWIANDLNAAAFFGSPFLGNGRNTQRGQPISTVNMGIFKNTKVGEKLTVQFQAQAFNLMNTRYLGTPDPVLSDVFFTQGGGPPAFTSTAYNFSGGGNNIEGGGNSSANLTYDGISRRRLLFGLKLIF